MSFNHQEIEKKWQKVWESRKAGAVSESGDRKNTLYYLVMFPYPSGSGLHVGHVESYSAVDMLARMQRMKGKEVLFPMGFDAFGLPAENYAIKTGVHPAETTQTAMETFRTQLKSIGLSFDWDREISTADPEYYRWTQWLFLLFFKNGLAYRAKSPVNWCTGCHTVLANEQVLNGVCERCSSEVMQKELEQWFFKITDFADRLLDGLDTLDWPDRIKAMQRNWIGKSEGAKVAFKVKDSEESIDVFTTRPDTLFGATYIVLSPEHPLVEKIAVDTQLAEIEVYQKEAAKKSALERTELQKDKTGVFTGSYAINPVNGEEVPVWIADYVMVSYGTGAIMAVPAHDERDFEFATKYKLPIRNVVESSAPVKDECFTGNGTVINSGFLDGTLTVPAKQVMIDWLKKEEVGQGTTTYRVRDWLVSRQRYWGAPIPIIWCEKCGALPVPEEDLPVLLPTDVDFKPTGESPLANSESFHDVKCPACGDDARRESDTMDTFVDSSWYYLRYCDPKNKEAFAEKEKIEQWCPVDLYVGGAEHAVMHLLYARFFAYALHDLGYTTYEEPFLKLRNQGLILGPDGEKMSKSRGNVVGPDSVISEYGADAIRLYEMFLGPLEDAKPWDTKGIVGVRRFLDRVWSVQNNVIDGEDADLLRTLHKTIKKVSSDLDQLKFNTAISALMVMTNEMIAAKNVPRNIYLTFVQLLAPLAPHIAEEIWESLGRDESIFVSSWPEFDAELVIDNEIELAVQINGKVRATITLAPDADEELAMGLAREDKNIQKYIEGKEFKKVIYVAGRILNIVL